GAGVVLRVARIPFHDQLELAVAVEIGGEGVVGAVCLLRAVGGDEVRGPVQRDVEVAALPRGDGLARPYQVLPLGTARDRFPARAGALDRDPVLRVGGALGVQQVRRVGDRLGGDPLTVAEDDEAGGDRFVAREARGDQHPVLGGDGERTAIQAFGVPLQGALRRSGLGGRCGAGGDQARAGEGERQREQQGGGPAQQSRTTVRSGG